MLLHKINRLVEIQTHEICAMDVRGKFKEKSELTHLDLLSTPQSGGIKCRFQKKSVVCDWRIGIRKGSGDVTLLSPPREAVVQFNQPGKQAREE